MEIPSAPHSVPYGFSTTGHRHLRSDDGMPKLDGFGPTGREYRGAAEAHRDRAFPPQRPEMPILPGWVGWHGKGSVFGRLEAGGSTRLHTYLRHGLAGG